MTDVVIFPSVLGVRAGIHDAVARLSAAGHTVHVVDQIDGRTFDDYEPAMELSDSLGVERQFATALDSVSQIPDGMVVLGFSSGVMSAGHVSQQRKVSGVVMVSGTVPLTWLDVEWPDGVPAQLHQTVDDEFREPDSDEANIAGVRAAGAEIEVFDYPGSAHLFIDSTLPKEFDAESTELLWSRILAFVDRVGG